MAPRHFAATLLLTLAAACGSNDEVALSSYTNTGPGDASATGGGAASGGGTASGGSAGSGGIAKDAGGDGAAGGAATTATGGGAGTDGSAATGGSSVVDAADDACNIGCTAHSPSGWCTAPTVEWICGGGAYDHQRMIDAGCQDLATGAIRYCCPAAFLPQCH